MTVNPKNIQEANGNTAVSHLHWKAEALELAISRRNVLSFVLREKMMKRLCLVSLYHGHRVTFSDAGILECF